MKQRCDNDNNPKYPRYGGRGITYDPRWSGFEDFYADMKDGYQEGLTIDRKDNDGNYTKDNCRWISGSDNSSRSKLKKVYKLKKVPKIRRYSGFLNESAIFPVKNMINPEVKAKAA